MKSQSMLSSILLIVAVATVMNIARAEAKCSVKPAEPLTREKPLLKSSETDFHSLGELSSLLDPMVAEAKSILIFVHGRGNEPHETFVDGYAERLRDYGVSLLVFSWISCPNPKPWPDDRAEAAGAQLAELIRAIGRYRQSHPAAKSVKFNLMTHSMGAIVLQHAASALASSPPPAPDVFENIVISAAAAELEWHVPWVEALRVQKRIYVTLHAGDLVLGHIAEIRNEKPPVGRLGRGVDIKGAPPLVARNAVYVDLTAPLSEGFGIGGKIAANHAYYVISHQRKDRGVCKFYRAALNGEAIDWSSGFKLRKPTGAKPPENLLLLDRDKGKKGECLI